MTTHKAQPEEAGTLRTELPPFAMVPEALLYDADMSHLAVRVYGILMRHAGPNGIYPGRERLAKLTGVGVNTVDRSLAELRKAGWVSSLRRGLGLTNLYTLHANPRVPTSGDSGVTTGGASESPLVGTLESPLVGRKRKPLNERKKNETARDVDAMFETFWSLYPRKVGKPVARRKFAQLIANRVDLTAVRRGLDAWCTYWEARGEPEFVPHPSTWLNQERWNDEPPAIAAGAGNRQAPLDVLDRLDNQFRLLPDSPDVPALPPILPGEPFKPPTMSNAPPDSSTGLTGALSDGRR